MDYRNLYEQRGHFFYRAAELQHRAEQERLAQIAVSGQRQMRFYYPALVSVGRWLMASGLHLQKRYGELRDLPAVTAHTASPHNA